jgi:hypothetical protein
LFSCQQEYVSRKYPFSILLPKSRHLTIGAIKVEAQELSNLNLVWEISLFPQLPIKPPLPFLNLPLREMESHAGNVLWKGTKESLGNMILTDEIDPSIKDYRVLASYDWLDHDSPTIIVPGYFFHNIH